MSVTYIPIFIGALIGLAIGLVVAALFSIRSRKKGRNDILRMFNFVKLKNGNILMTLKK